MGQTRIIEVMAGSTNPKIAAEFANRLVQDYIEENVQSHWEMTQKTGDFLTKQIDDMRAKLERSEDLMQAYARQNDLVFTDEKTNGQRCAAERPAGRVDHKYRPIAWKSKAGGKWRARRRPRPCPMC